MKKKNVAFFSLRARREYLCDTKDFSDIPQCVPFFDKLKNMHTSYDLQRHFEDRVLEQTTTGLLQIKSKQDGRKCPDA